MTPITAPTSLDSPDAVGALPGKAPRQTPPPGAFPTGGATGSDECHATLPGGTEAGRGGDGGDVVRSGKPRNDPNLAPRCGAKARTTGLGCRAPAMANGRCRMHGGGSTGPRTPEGLARLAAAHTKHGNDGAAWRAVRRYQWSLIVRSRLLAGAFRFGPYLPPDLAARMRLGASDLASPPHYSNVPVTLPGAGDTTGAKTGDPGGVGHGRQGRDARGRFVARARPTLRGRRLEREAVRIEVAKLAPWRAGIAWARALERAVLETARRQKAMLSLPPGACPGGGRSGRVGPVLSLGGRHGPLSSDETPYNRGRWGRTVWRPVSGLSVGRGRGPEGQDKTLYNGRRCGRMGWLPGWGLSLGRGCGPRKSNKTPYNRRRSGRTVWLPGWGLSLGLGCGLRTSNKTPYNRRRWGRTVGLPGWGLSLGLGCGPRASDKTPYNRRRWGRTVGLPGWGLSLGLGCGPRASNKTPYNRRRWGRTVWLPGWGLSLGLGCRLRKPDNTPW
jgi:hypothetical protein